jgi:SAM-dependent methyltransferase
MPRIDQNRPMPMPKGTAGDVVERERSYYDGGDFTRGSAARARRLIERSIGEFNTFPELFELFEARGKNVLDYGCGRGYVSLRLAEAGASSVTAIDLSVGELDVARARAEAEGMADRISFVACDAHTSPFPAASFDLIVGAAILHHLDLESALLEVRRLLRPDGQAVFVEPLRDNPILRLGRRASPGARTADEHPLTPDDWTLCARIFSGFSHYEREFLSIPLMPVNLVLPLRGRQALARHVLALDERVLTRYPRMCKYARVTFLRFRA